MPPMFKLVTVVMKVTFTEGQFVRKAVGDRSIQKNLEESFELVVVYPSRATWDRFGGERSLSPTIVCLTPATDRRKVRANASSGLVVIDVHDVLTISASAACRRSAPAPGA